MAKKKSATKKHVSCKCFDQVNEQLKPMGVALNKEMSMNFDTLKASVEGPFLAVHWRDKPIRGKRLPAIVCAYCPFCGKKKYHH